MPEETDKPQPADAPEASTSATSPSPVEVAGTPPEAGAATPAPEAAQPSPAATATTGATPDSLTDGTVPTVLKAGGAKDKELKGGGGSLTSVYRRADVATTLLTFIGAVVAAGLILGGYWYFTHSKPKVVAPTKATDLSKEQLDKLGSFFGGNSAGSSSEVLTVSSASLFTGRVAVNNDLKVIGGLSVGGTTALTTLTVDSTSTLAATNIRGALTVVGPTNLQSPAVLAAGASINGNLTVSGNGSFGGSLSAGLINTQTITVSGTLNLAGHLAITGVNPSASAEAGAGSGAAANVDGNDSAGTVTVNTTTTSNTVPGTGVQLVKVTFHTPYTKTPRVIITPVTLSAGAIGYFVSKTNSYFIIATSTAPTSSTGYSFDFWVVQ